MVKEFDYKRPVTHTQYRHGNKKVKKGGLKGRLHTIITDDTFKLNTELKKLGYYWFANSKFWAKAEHKARYITPLWGGGFSLILFFGFILAKYASSDGDKLGDTFYIVLSIPFLGIIFFTLYYFTMPRKELIFNREDGLVTFPGFMWHKNITMPVDTIIFTMSGPGAQGLGAFKLMVERPDWLYSKYLCSLGNSCYEDLSYFLWYMDKNRPLPPGTAFDDYRQQDFERRKAERFPKPLFPSDIPTPEATPEQQKQRERIGGW